MFFWSRHTAQMLSPTPLFSVALSLVPGVWTALGAVLVFVVFALPSSLWEVYRARHSSGLAGVAPVFSLFVLSVSVLPICFYQMPGHAAMAKYYYPCILYLLPYLSSYLCICLGGLIDARQGCPSLEDENLPQGLSVLWSLIK
jgi:hypothetical protein